jgi:hypothetical protein
MCSWKRACIVLYILCRIKSINANVLVPNIEALALSPSQTLLFDFEVLYILIRKISMTWQSL